VSGSPWGLRDIHDVISLNREYNEKATDISDIINYHAAPVTVIVGAKAQPVGEGAEEGLVRPAEGRAGLQPRTRCQPPGPLEYMELLKTAMHEMTGVHETALGQSRRSATPPVWRWRSSTCR
jgi:hypothetical protein